MTKIGIIEREQSRESFMALFQEASRQRKKIYHEGITPTEVWLGPKETAILCQEINWLHSEGQTKPNIIEKLEGTRFLNLTVKLAMNDGVHIC